MPIDASHGWSNYHWQRTSSALKNIPVRRYHSASLGPSVQHGNDRLAESVDDENQASDGGFRQAPNPSARCVTGQVSCATELWKYGLARFGSIAVKRGAHLVGRSSQNNTYSMAQYNNVAWRQLVICQEIGHTFGLGHVNVRINTPNTGSCMDYTNDPDGGRWRRQPQRQEQHASQCARLCVDQLETQPHRGHTA